VSGYSSSRQNIAHTFTKLGLTAIEIISNYSANFRSTDVNFVIHARAQMMSLKGTWTH